MSTFKRLGSFVLALIMVCSLIYVGPVEAAAVETAETCPHCGEVMSEISWTEWTPTSGCSITESGHYYMAADFEGVKTQLKIGVSGDTVNVADVVLDLRGNLLKSSNTRVFAVYSGNTLSVMDTVGKGEIQGSITGASQNGCTIRVDEKAIFNLYSGTIRDIATSAHLGSGGTIGSEKGTVNIRGGEVYGGTAIAGGSIWVKTGNLNISGGLISGGTAANEAANPYGGNIYVQNTNFSMTDGMVIGGTGTSEAKTPAGGNIYISNTSSYTASITGGLIQTGRAENGNGGNIYVNTGSLTIGGTAVIDGGYAQRSLSRNNGGGNIYAQTNANLTISGGTISNGVCEDSYGGNIFCRGTLTMTDGTIFGGSAVNGGNLFLSGYEGVRESAISGGVIRDGYATTGKIDRTTDDLGYDGGNIYLNSATLNISGGEIIDSDGGIAILVFSQSNTLAKEEPWGAVVNLNTEEDSALASNLSGKIYLVNDVEMNAAFGEILFSENGEAVWYATAHTHDWVNHEAVAPSCNADGNIAYQTCSICGAAQTADENPMPLGKFGWVLSATGEHTLEHHDAVEVTCDTDGHEAFDYCTTCECFFYEDALKLTYQAGIIPATGHNWVSYEAVAPTCNADGNIAYQQCGLCGAAQTADENPMPLGKFGWVLSATGEHTLEHHDAVEATCTENGHEAFDYCTTCECFFYEDPLKMTYQAGIILAPGHDYVNGICSVCYAADPDYSPEEQPAEPVEVRFEFGANGSASHVDGQDLGSSKTYTQDGYTLELTGMSKVYGPAYDAKGNSCIKLGTSKLVGAFSFTVPEDVTEVVIYAAKYKTNNSVLKVNDTTYTLTKNSNDGEYDEIVVDTSENKTVTVTTVASNYRAMIDAIVYKVAASGETDTSSKLITNIGNLTFIVGEPQEFVFSTLANENAGVMVVGTSNFSDASAIEKLEYYEVSNGQWYELSGDFGPATGFPLTNATSKFRVTFAKDGEYTFTASMKSVETDEVLCSVEATAKVNDPDGKVLSIVEANAKGVAMAHNTYTETKYTVTGVIKDIYQTTYGNMHITDEEGNELTIYGLYSADGKTRFDKMDPQPAVGETITVYGILGQYNGIAQIKDGWMVDHIHSVHVWTDIEAVAPTCHTDGNIAYQLCNICGAAQTAGENPMPLSKYGWVLAAAHTALEHHDAVEATCDTDGHEAFDYCSDCQVFIYEDALKLSYQDGVIPASGHNWVSYEAVAPTCHTDGNIAYQQCDLCGAAQTAEEEPKPLSKFGWVLAAAHTALEHHDAVEATCDTDGHEAFDYCSDCQVFIYEDALKLTYQDGVIPANGHTWVDHEAVEPTCDTEGNIAYQQCSVCGAAQTMGENPIPLGRYEWILGVKHNIQYVEAKDATTEEAGNIEYWYCEDCGYAWLDENLTQVTNLLSVIIPKLETVKGDYSGDGKIDNDDVVALLWNSLFPEDYPLTMDGDLTGDGKTNNDDVVALLWHSLFPEEYPL